MRKTLLFIVILSFTLLLSIPISSKNNKKSKVEIFKKIKIEKPKNYSLLKWYLTPNGKHWAYLVAEGNKSKYSYKRYKNYYVVTDAKKYGPLNDLWSSKYELYISPSGRHYALMNLIDGGWNLYVDSHQVNYSFSKQKIIEKKEALFIHYYDWRKDSIMVLRLE